MKKIIIISGGSDGLGKETAKILSPQNTVIILAPNKTKLESVAKKYQCDYETCDVKDNESVKQAITNIIKKYQRIDCLINNAGIWIEGELDNNDPKRIKEVLEVNTLGLIYLTKAVIPFMKQQKIGLIVNIISQGGLYGKAERSVYTASKFAVTGFTKSLQPELVKYGIAVTGLYPGKMNTKMFEKIGIKKDLSDAMDPQEVVKVIEFILTFNNKIVFPEIGIKNINN